MRRVAVFVDAGYLFAQGSTLLAGSKLQRGEIRLDCVKVCEALAAFAGRTASGCSLLRIYWYDGTSTGPTAQHTTLAFQPNLKLRLGFVNSVGEQKGVDSLIVTDMISLARNRAITEAILFSGDEDLRVGVQQAQELGVRVHLLGIHPSRGTQSLFLMQEADTTHEWGDADLAGFLTCVPRTTATTMAQTDGTDALADPCAEIAANTANALGDQELESVLAQYNGTSLIDKQCDGKLLARGTAALGHALTGKEKRALRAAFIAACEARVAANAAAKALEPA